MENIKFPQLPFITREMLDFGSKSIFDLEVVLAADNNLPLDLTGATKEGIFTFRFVPAGALARETFTFRVPGVPLWMSLNDSSAGFERGQVYAKVSLRINTDLVHILASGYVDRSKGLSWPASDYEPSASGIGRHQLLNGTDPAAGAEIDHSLPDNRFLKIRAIGFTLVTDANAADRRVHAQLQFAGVSVGFEFISDTLQVASTTRRYMLTATPAGNLAADDDIIIPIPPDLMIGPSWSFNTETENIQVGDNFGNQVFIVEQWFNI